MQSEVATECVKFMLQTTMSRKKWKTIEENNIHLIESEKLPNS